MSECTHDCSTCGESCGQRQNPQSLLKEHHPEARVGKVIGIVSGKGGVGKSMVTSQMAVTMRRRGYQVGILDADVTGPSIPKAFGLHENATGDARGLYPCESSTGIKVENVVSQNNNSSINNQPNNIETFDMPKNKIEDNNS